MSAAAPKCFRLCITWRLFRVLCLWLCCLHGTRMTSEHIKENHHFWRRIDRRIAAYSSSFQLFRFVPFLFAPLPRLASLSISVNFFASFGVFFASSRLFTSLFASFLLLDSIFVPLQLHAALFAIFLSLFTSSLCFSSPTST